MSKLLRILTALLLASLTALVITCLVVIVQARRDVLGVIAEVKAAAVETRAAAASVRQFADFQSAQLRSDGNQKVIRQSLAVGAAFVGVARSINTSTLPALSSAIGEFRQANQELTSLINLTNKSLNGQLLPEATRATASLNRAIEGTAKTLNASVSSTSAAVEKLIASGVLTAEQATALLSDPHWKTALANLETSTASLAASSANVAAMTSSGAEASKELPQIAKDVQAFTAQQSKYGKIVILARIIRALTF